MLNKNIADIELTAYKNRRAPHPIYKNFSFLLFLLNLCTTLEIKIKIVQNIAIIKQKHSYFFKIYKINMNTHVTS